MTDLDANLESRGNDTSPLTVSQLSDHELEIIQRIEARFQKAPHTPSSQDPVDQLDYCQKTQKRDRRVLLLDGGRGSGKTSLLLTMTAWWHGAQRDGVNHRIRNEERKSRLTKLRGPGSYGIPENVRVLRIIDFDPLPQEMPLIAGIVQAWKPIADHIDRQFGGEHKDGLLADAWESLFQIATVGWTPIAGGKGLVEQIIDREEQVKDWYRVIDNWQEFVYRVMDREREAAKRQFQSANPVPSVFVIMIDDVDLQVRRIRELLPALRMLYHPNVFFIVAADRRHMVNMLELDFEGQQRRLGETQYDASDLSGQFDHWPRTLAEAAFQKVFAPANRWSLNALGLRDLLAFSNLKDALNMWESTSKKLGAYGRLGDYLNRIDVIGRFSEVASDRAATESGNVKDQSHTTDELGLPTMMFYRRAQQLSELVTDRGSSANTALELMGQIIEGDDSSHTQIRLSPAPDNRGPKLEYLASGELAAVFPKVYGVEIDVGKEIVSSGRPEFIFRNGPPKELAGGASERHNIWPPLLAASLRADGFGLVASGLQWNVYLALAWTRVQLPDGSDLPFWWRVHLLPSPLRFVAWARDWAKFIQQISVRSEETSGGEDKSSQIERLAYGWVYHQLWWMTKNPSKFSQTISDPVVARVGPNKSEDWKKLLAQEPDKSFLKEEGDEEHGTWRNRTLPLLARPELFLPPHVQDLLLDSLDTSKETREDLRVRRKKLITDAFAARYASNLAGPPAESPKDVDALATKLDAEYEGFYNKPSPWIRKVVGHTDKRRATADKSSRN